MYQTLDIRPESDVAEDDRAGAMKATGIDHGTSSSGNRTRTSCPRWSVFGPFGGRSSGADPSGAQLPTAEDGGAEASAPPRRSLSPSRAGDFLACPLLYRFRVIDRLPEPPSPAAARGTLVHAVLERLFDGPAAGRTPQTAHAMLAPQWERLIGDEPELAGLFDGEEQQSAWLAEARDMLDRYFTLEDPTRLEPRHREHAVEAVLESGLLLRGYIDRLDVAPDGEIRIVDYKTGTAPKEEYEAQALFQMKFYAVVLWLTQQRVPKLLQLMYLGNGEIVRYGARTSLTCGPRCGRSTRCGGPSSGLGPRATGGRGPAGSAPGARTRRYARPSAALPRRCPTSGPHLPGTPRSALLGTPRSALLGTPRPALPGTPRPALPGDAPAGFSRGRPGRPSPEEAGPGSG